MGQRVVFDAAEIPTVEPGQVARAVPSLTIFSTALGWMGLVGQNRRVERLLFGHAAASEIWSRFLADGEDAPSEADWFPELRARLEAYAQGERIDFSDVLISLLQPTAFQRRVLAALRGVTYGQTVSYAELAAKAGSPRAARAVGSVMAKNRVPLILPCHRVVASGGHLGGFSAPRGIDFKRQLLEMEAKGSGCI